ncbi:hypothetical protein ACFYTF_20575 [Nocardia thailandica]|uniref:Uncharacterized protein n=1 Tax=Nocardia thailandica TaxID=257275 RepID=A0ABW6PSP8_9NOCA
MAREVGPCRAQTARSVYARRARTRNRPLRRKPWTGRPERLVSTSRVFIPILRRCPPRTASASDTRDMNLRQPALILVPFVLLACPVAAAPAAACPAPPGVPVPPSGGDPGREPARPVLPAALPPMLGAGFAEPRDDGEPSPGSGAPSPASVRPAATAVENARRAGRPTVLATQNQPQGLEPLAAPWLVGAAIDPADEVGGLSGSAAVRAAPGRVPPWFRVAIPDAGVDVDIARPESAGRAGVALAVSVVVGTAADAAPVSTKRESAGPAGEPVADDAGVSGSAAVLPWVVAQLLRGQTPRPSPAPGTAR